MSELKEINTYKVQDKVVSLGGGNFVVITAQTMNEMEENTRRMGEMILQLGTMMGTMQRRLDAMEARQAAVTISHADAKRLQALMRIRADQLCAKHGLGDPESRKAIRAAIRKDVLKRCNVKDLHDIPEAKLEGTERQIDSWTSIRLIMERRAGT